MAELRNQTLRLPQKELKQAPGLEGALRRRDIQDYFEKRLRPLLSKMKDKTRIVVHAFPVFVRGKPMMRYEFAKV